MIYVGRSLLSSTNNFTKLQELCQNTGKTCVAFKKKLHPLAPHSHSTCPSSHRSYGHHLHVEVSRHTAQVEHKLSWWFPHRPGDQLQQIQLLMRKCGAWWLGGPPKDLSPKVPQSSYVTWRCHGNSKTCHGMTGTTPENQPLAPAGGGDVDDMEVALGGIVIQQKHVMTFLLNFLSCWISTWIF